MRLSVPLSQQQVDAASKIRVAHLKQWRVSDSALDQLGQRLPGFSHEECLLKAVAVNAIYGTQVLAIVRMANHICTVMAETDAENAGVELVERIVDMPLQEGEKKRERISFAAKFCHFFVSGERFPIYDEAARDAIKLHLGKNGCFEDKKHRYRAFVHNFSHLRKVANLNCRARDLDRYLWLTGMYLRWLKRRSKRQTLVNAELQHLFHSPPSDAAALLDVMLPRSGALLRDEARKRGAQSR